MHCGGALWGAKNNPTIREVIAGGNAPGKGPLKAKALKTD